MLRIIKDNFSADTHGKIADEIVKLIEKGGSSYMIVPEQQTVMSECIMAELLPDNAPRFFEVTNFSRLADSIFRSLGGLAGEYCDNGKKSLVMWQVLTELSPALSMTGGKRDISQGLVERAMSAVKEVESLGLSSDELALWAKSDSLKLDKRLADKLSDLARIHSLYKKLLSEKYADSGEMLQVMAKKLEENPDFLSDTAIYIEGFTSFTEPQYRLISLLSRKTSVTVHLTVQKKSEDFFEYREITDTESRLKSGAKKSGADIKILSQNTSQRMSESLSEISSLLWCKSLDFDNITLQNPSEIRIFEARETYEECDFVAADIKRKVMAGASLSDFAIIARRSEDYSGILDVALKKADLPAFFSYRRDISSFEVIKLIYTAYSIIRGGFSREDVLTYAKCGLSGISRDACDEFEMYITTWQITGNRFTDGLIWNMNPDGYTQRRREDIDEFLVRINETKNKLILPLIWLKENAEAAKTAKEQAQVLLDFLVRLNVEKTLEERAMALEMFGENEYAEENRRLWQLICDSLDTIVTLLADMPSGVDAFLSQIKILFSSVDMGKIPAHSDEITVGSADMIRLFDKKYVYLVGVNEGEFPRAAEDNSYFSDKDKLTLSEIGLPIEPDLEIKSARELYVFTRAFAYAKESVTLLYTSASTRFKATKRAAVIDRIISLTGGALEVKKISSLPSSDRVFTPEYALRRGARAAKDEKAAIDKALITSGYGEALKISRGKIKNTDLSLGKEICREFSSKPLALTQSKIDAFVGCPMAYFCRYTIKLTEDRLAEFDASGIGSFIHAILENFFKTLSYDKKACGELTEDEILERTKKSAEKYLSLFGESVSLSSERTKIKLERITRAAYPIMLAITREFANSKYEPRFFELQIGSGEKGSPDPIRIKPEGESEISIYGIIDRVDTYKSGDDVYVRVVDYKTGQKSFSPDDVERGENLQMFLYLKSIIDTESKEFRERVGVGEGGKMRPAGVIYLKTSLSDVRIDTPSDEAAIEKIESEMEREGMVLYDDDSISAMNLRYTPLYSSRYPNKIPESKTKFLYTEEEFDSMMQTIEDTVKSLAKNIRSGDIRTKSEPRSSHDKQCEYCKFKPICRQAIVK